MGEIPNYKTRYFNSKSVLYTVHINLEVIYKGGMLDLVLQIRIRCFFTPRDPGWSNGRIRDGAMVGSGSGIKHPGSATLVGPIRKRF
jgi:hypothetical protein